MTSSRPTAPVDRTILRGRAVLPDRIIEDAVVVCEAGLIVWVGPTTDAAADVRADAPALDEGVTLLPGLVDLHNHGGGGSSFPDAATAQEALVAAREHRAYGTTSMLGSLVTADAATLVQRAGVLADLVERGDLIGIHLEGPFLSEVRCGAQNPADMLAGSAELVREIAAAGRGAFATMTPCSVAASMSMLSTPMPARPTMTRSDAASNTSRLTSVPERTMSPFASETAFTNASPSTS